MNVKLNNRDITTSAESLAALLQECEIDTTGVAVALNFKVVARSSWGEVTLTEGDSIVVVSAVYGG